jgi:hypothetical protein
MDDRSTPIWSGPTVAIPLTHSPAGTCLPNVILWVLEESQIEGCKHQNDSDVHHQSFPEMVPEDQDIYSDDDGYHRHHVRDGNHRFAIVI